MGAYIRGRRLWNSQAVSSTNTYKSSVLVKNECPSVVIVVDKTSTAAGTLTVEVCCASEDDFKRAVAKDAAAGSGTTNVDALLWSTYTDLTPPAITSGAQRFNLKFTRLGAPLLRLVYANASGSGAITAEAGSVQA